MDISFDDGASVTLEQMLNVKEQRVQRQLQYLRQYHLPIISLTLVIPGAIKASSGSQYLFAEAMAAIEQYFQLHHISRTLLYQANLITGAEAMIVFNCDPIVLKQHCIAIEEAHPLGRLWDIDVLEPITQVSLSRRNFLHKPRRCLVCQQPAKVCGRSRQHSNEEIIHVIKQKIHCYQTELGHF